MKKSNVLRDIDGTLLNLALMALSAYYKMPGYRVILRRDVGYMKADTCITATPTRKSA